jgi:hypothetical protein
VSWFGSKAGRGAAIAVTAELDNFETKFEARLIVYCDYHTYKTPTSLEI